MRRRTCAALDSGSTRRRVEDQRQAASYFCLRTTDDGWQFLGLDTGYHGHYMNVPAAAQQAVARPVAGRQGGSRGDIDRPALAVRPQPVLPAGQRRRPTRARHHRAGGPGRGARRRSGVAPRQARRTSTAAPCCCRTTSSTRRSTSWAPTECPRSADPHDCAWVNTALWRQFGHSFGDNVAAWIWGHEHNLGDLRERLPTAGLAGPDRARGSLPDPARRGAAPGHAAIPVRRQRAALRRRSTRCHSNSPTSRSGSPTAGTTTVSSSSSSTAPATPARSPIYEVAGTDPTPTGALPGAPSTGSQHPPWRKDSS